MVGIVVDPDGDLAGVEGLRAQVFAAGMVPLVIGPHGGTVAGMAVQRTFATARSVELDAVLLAGSPAPAPDALPARDAKAGAADTAIDPRVVLLVEECFRHAKVIGAWGAGSAALDAAGCGQDAGIVRGESAESVFAGVQEQMSFHRAWERFTATA
jgi:catalase